MKNKVTFNYNRDGMSGNKKSKKVLKEYSSIQVSLKFKEELDTVKEEHHINSYENTIKYLIEKKQ